MPRAGIPTLLLAFLTALPLPAAASTVPSPAPVAAPLSIDQVVDNLVRRDQERARALRSAEATRIYRLSYRGFPVDRDAEMTVRALYTSPSTKSFEIISQSGSRLLLDHVLKRLLETEKEAAQPKIRDRYQLNRANYEFSLAGYEPSSQGAQYILEVAPKSKSSYVYRGKIWVDANDFAVTRIDAEPAQNPSFWTKKSEIRHEYTRVEGFWLPARNESTSYVRLGGRITLTIEYKNYRINRAP